MDISIIIVNYNTKDLTLQTIQSVCKSKTQFAYEVIVVDNASTDDSIQAIRDEFPQITVIQNDKNLGFSKANNIGIKQATGRYILLLNSDTVVMEDTLELMVNFMDENKDVGASGCKVILPDGSLDKACKRSFPTPLNAIYNALKLDVLYPASKRFGQYNLTYLDNNKIHYIDCLVGAFMMVRREAIEQVGMLDEEFFMYGEDIDWCYRIKLAGWKIVYYPLVKIIHYKGGSSKKRNPKLIYEFYRAMYLFYKKHYKNTYPWLVTAAVYSGIGIMMGVKLIINQFKKH
ncbi:glycosyltransferase family 2 protein [Anaerosolibacter sp.]|uniref:glycosyltransferase family 2 protein n=1 Tax=Anaerosolibacter sp. TaxID=1872527 RepID=UPI0039F09D81